MKRFLLGSTMLLGLAASAAAADLQVYSKAPPPLWSWTGFYFGIQGGAGWGTTEDSVTAFQCITPGGVCGPVTVFTPAGALKSNYGINGLHGGGTAGFNWQNGPVVFGVEGDISGSNIDGSGDCANSLGHAFNAGNPSASCNTKLTWFATLTGRVGVVVDRALLFVKGGAAWGHFDQNSTIGFVTGGPGGLFLAGAIGNDRVGYTVGTGIEYALWNSWSAKVEYDFMDFGNKSVDMLFSGTLLAPISTNLFFDDRERVHVVRAGLNYRFNWTGGPIFSKY
jgi:outer membrane immunogenic protein